MEPAFEPSRLLCPKCGAVGSMARHAHYMRHFVFLREGKVTDEVIAVTRLRCISCGATHALLPLAAVPYSVFSIRFIAMMLLDSLDHTFPSIEVLCAHYKIAINTFYRIRRRFESCVRIARGITAKKDCVYEMARKMLENAMTDLDFVLSSFFDACGMSFCQSRSP